MTSAPAKEKRKEEKDNIFVDMLYNLVVYLPVLVVSWLWNKITDD
jgi:hypothetical protein